MFGEIGIEKILFLLIIVLLLFGAKKIPEIGSSLGRGIREFKRSVSELQHETNAPPPSSPISPAPRAELGAPRDVASAADAADPAAAARPDDARSEPKRLLM